MLDKFRKVATRSVTKTNETLIFGDQAAFGKTEIDEACFGKKRKNNKGTVWKKKWVFGIKGDGRKVFLTTVPDRKKATLIPYITKHISRNATIHHDDWPSYRHLDRIGYKHQIVKHTDGFKSPEGTCTNGIEGVWGNVKQRFGRMHGIPNKKLDDYISEYSFRYMNKDRMIDAMILAMAVE